MGVPGRCRGGEILSPRGPPLRRAPAIDFDEAKEDGWALKKAIIGRRGGRSELPNKSSKGARSPPP